MSGRSGKKGAGGQGREGREGGREGGRGEANERRKKEHDTERQIERTTGTNGYKRFVLDFHNLTI